MPPLPRLLPALALTGALALAAAPTRAEAPMTDAQRQAIEGVIRDYLLKNPEVLQEAMAELEKRQQEAQRQAQASALKETRDILHNAATSYTAGNPNGDVTLVEFFDYNCGYCKRALGDIQALMKSDPKLKVVLKDFPVLGPDSVEASKVALAAKQQLKGDKLFEYHTRLLETRGRVNGERAIAVAREMGLDIARLQKDMQSPDVQTALQENVGLGDKLGLSGTPAFIIGEEIIPGAVGAEPIRKTIAGVRQCGHATC
ncbi:DsbA family protein [Methylobacterium nodulans]|uniref:DSBA oxidoreductase n=1 Tax=Methylobacterium nodulans (strain LMG 21967 / CNCM I-2342 / ORS 2060) TaxID=460265 RepID=B8IU11_METNO|nr:DsbA family protein [Methylobacterium nodulans]ACL60869.1 DSBA oxidoreductase [Methylobacterium nodulans ORS 2060]